MSLRIWLMYCNALQREGTPAALGLCKKALSRVLNLAASKGGVGADHDVAARAAYLHSDVCFLTATSDDERAYDHRRGLSPPCQWRPEKTRSLRCTPPCNLPLGS